MYNFVRNALLRDPDSTERLVVTLGLESGRLVSYVFTDSAYKAGRELDIHLMNMCRETGYTSVIFVRTEVRGLRCRTCGGTGYVFRSPKCRCWACDGVGWLISKEKVGELVK